MKKIILVFIIFLLALPSGFSSTTIQLNCTNGGVLQDTYGRKGGTETDVYGLDQMLDQQDYGSNQYYARTQVMFNISSIPLGATIDKAIWAQYSYMNDGNQNHDLRVYNIYDGTWDGYNESTFNWNLQTCGTAIPFSDTADCNTTIMDSLTSAPAQWDYFNVTPSAKYHYSQGNANMTFLVQTDDSGTARYTYSRSREYCGVDSTQVHYLNITYTVVADTTPPSITYFNLTNEAGCENWNTDKTNACSTSSVTPTVQFNTDETAYCAISGNSSSVSGMNYSDIGIARNCTGAASGEGTTSHFCTLISQDELVYDTSYLYISCKDANNNQNHTSSSGPLKLSITGLESAGRDSIGIGIQNALLSGYTNYTYQQIYARNLSNGQIRGTFDTAAKKGNKMWAFNRIGVSDSYVNMFNLTPVLYNLELANKTSLNITKQVELLINATK